MNKPKNQFPLKIVLSYVVLGALAVAVSYFLYTEYTIYIAESESPETTKIIETGTLISDVYETDSFSRIALLTKRQSDYDAYLEKSDSLLYKIDALKDIIELEAQRDQLDSVKLLIHRKNTNIEQLRLLKLTSEQDTTLDDILAEFEKFNLKTGRLNLKEIVRYPDYLTREERRVWQLWTDYFTETNRDLDTVQLSGMTIDSLLSISKYIVVQAKNENTTTRNALREKENELLENELSISSKLRSMITEFDTVIAQNNRLQAQQRLVSTAKTKKMLKVFGIAGMLLMLLFSYLLVTDFFKSEKFKNSLEQEKQYSEDLLKSREQLMATVSHDLKTPLNTIVGYTELFTHTDLTDKQRNYSQQIAASAHFISKMADDLLDFSKLEAGKLLIEKAPFSLENLLHQIARASKDLHIQKEVDLHLYVDDSLSGKLFESDPLRIQQIVNNLVSNAYKFTDKGRIQITANLLKTKDETHIVEIAVTDSGIGISKEKQQLIFKEFTQAEKDTFQKFGGSGLGLAISRKIAKLLGGSLEVESILGEGSTFFFTLPLAPSAVTKLGDAPVISTESLNSSLKALIFDDDPAMLRLLKELFAQMNILSHGFERFEDFRENKEVQYDFVLTDIEMPIHSGFDVLQAFKSGVIENYDDQPVIAMTGTKKMTLREYVARGFADMLQKPFSKNQLIAALSPLFINKIETRMPELEVFKNPTNEIFDLSFMNSFLSNQESLNEVLNIFYDQTKQDLEKIKGAIENYDCEVLAATAHKMLTMCRQLSAKRVNPILETMERCALENPTKTEMDSLFANLKIEIKTLVDSLQNREIAIP